MRLKKFLNENLLNYDQIVKECNIFLKEANNASIYLYHGTRKGSGKYKVDKNREPRDSTLDSHKFMNAVYKKQFGKRLRSETVFATFRKDVAAAYGVPMIILPIGNYTLYQNKKIMDASLDVFSNEPADQIYKNIMSVNLKSLLKEHKINNKLEPLFRPKIIVKPYKTLEKTFNTISNENFENIKKVIDILYDKLKQIFKETKVYPLNKLHRNPEIMIDCEDYYLVTQEQLDEIEKLWK